MIYNGCFFIPGASGEEWRHRSLIPPEVANKLPHLLRLTTSPPLSPPPPLQWRYLRDRRLDGSQAGERASLSLFISLSPSLSLSLSLFLALALSLSGSRSLFHLLMFSPSFLF